MPASRELIAQEAVRLVRDAVVPREEAWEGQRSPGAAVGLVVRIELSHSVGGMC